MKTPGFNKEETKVTEMENLGVPRPRSVRFASPFAALCFLRFLMLKLWFPSPN